MSGLVLVVVLGLLFGGQGTIGRSSADDGPTAQSVRTFTNTSSITINDNATATPWPSIINVSGLTGQISDVNVTLPSFTHTYPDDVDILLLGPHGQHTLLMSDAGGSPDATGINLTFDDEAAGALPDNAQLTSGAYRPTNFEGTVNDNFPVTVGVTPALTVFDGTAPNGNWSLYVRDDSASDTGSLANGWSLRITVPTVKDDKFTVTGKKLKVNAPGVLSNDSSHNTGNLTATLIKGPRKGTLTLKPSGAFTYRPDSGASGKDTFTYRASVPNGGGDTGKVTIKIKD